MRVATVDLSGLAGLSRTSGSDTVRSAAHAFENMDFVRNVGYTQETGAMSFSMDADWSSATDLTFMFAEMDALKTFTIYDLVSNQSGVSIASMLENDVALTSASFQTTDRIGASKIGTVTSMRRLFAGCVALTNANMYAIGTGERMPGTWNQFGAGDTGQASMFEGATAMTTVPTQGERPSVTIGPAFTKVLNGFVWMRPGEDSAPIYVLSANISVFGGPTNVQNLMTRPTLSGYAYNGEIYFSDTAANNNARIWTERRYGHSSGMLTVNFYGSWKLDSSAAEGAVPVPYTDSDRMTSNPYMQSKTFKTQKFVSDDGGQVDVQTSGERILPGDMLSPTASGYTAKIGRAGTEDAIKTYTGEVRLTEEGTPIAVNGSALPANDPSLATEESTGIIWCSYDEATGKFTPFTFGGTAVLKPNQESVTWNLYALPSQVYYQIELKDMGSSNSLKLPDRYLFSTEFTYPQITDVDGEGTDWSRGNDYAFLGWTVGANAPASWQSQDYHVAGEKTSGLGTKANQVITLYAQWAQAPSITYHVFVNGKQEPTMGSNPDANNTQVYGRFYSNANYDASGHLVNFYTVPPTMSQIEQYSQLPAGQTTDSGWTLNYEATQPWQAQEVTVDGQTRRIVSTSAILYRRIDSSTASIVFAPGYANATMNPYTTDYIYDHPLALEANRFVRTGYTFLGWSLKDPTKNAAPTVPYPNDGRDYTRAQMEGYLIEDSADLTNQTMVNLLLSEGALNGTIGKNDPGYYRDGLTFYAVWYAETFTITYVFGYDTSVAEQEAKLKAASANPWQFPTTYATGELGTVEGVKLPNPVRPGYRFAGWTGANGSVPQPSLKIKAGTAGDISYTANWTEENYTINYVLDNGEWGYDDRGNPVSAPTTYKVADLPVKIPNVEKRGYDFLGWDGAPGMGITKDLELPRGTTGNMILTARFKVHVYSLKMVTNGGTWAEGADYRETYTYEDRDYTLPTPIRKGYEFIGWTGSNGNSPQLSVTIAQRTLSSDLEYTANWKRLEYRLIFDLDGGSWPEGFKPETTYNVETKTMTIPEPIMSGGYTFGGWTGGVVDGSGKVIEPLSGSPKTFTIDIGSVGNRTYKAVWAENDYTVEYVLGDGAYSTDPKFQSAVSVSGQGFNTIGVDLPTAATIKRPGMLLVGWGCVSADQDKQTTTWFEQGKMSSVTLADMFGAGAEVTIDPGTGKSTVKLYALWASAVRDIVYNAYIGTPPTGPSQFYAEIEQPIQPATSSDYTFLGWYSMPLYDKDEVDTRIAGNESFTGDDAWKRNRLPEKQFEVDDGNGGKVTKTMQYIPGTFYDNAVLYAKWTYSIDFKSALTDKSGNVKGTGLPPSVTDVVWVPEGLYLRNAFGANADEMSRRLWDAFAWSVPQDANLPYDPKAEGYSFTNADIPVGSYNTDPDGRGTSVAANNRNVRQNLVAAANKATLYAQWHANTYLVQFEGYTGGMVNAQYWNTEFNQLLGNNRLMPMVAPMPFADNGSYVRVTYDEAWTIQNVVPDLTLFNLANPSTPYNHNYVFLGWSTSADAVVTNNGMVSPNTARPIDFAPGDTVMDNLSTGDKDNMDDFIDDLGNVNPNRTVVKLYAVWRDVDYFMQIDGNGGDKVNTSIPSTYLPDEAITATKNVTLPKNPYAREGYRFTGWSPNPDGSGGFYQPGRVIDLMKTPTARMTYYAIWEEIPYKIQFMPNNGSTEPVYTINSDYEQTGQLTLCTTEQANAENQGFSLVSWTQFEDGSGAQWTTGAKVTLERLMSELFKRATASAPAYVEKTIDGETVRVVTLYGYWSAQLTGDVPTQVTFSINRDTGESVDVDAGVRNMTQAPVKVMSFSTEFQEEPESGVPGLRYLFPNAYTADLKQIELSVDDVASGQKVSVPFGSTQQVGAGFVIPKGSTSAPAKLLLTMGLHLPDGLTSAYNRMQAAPEGGAELTRLTYTMGLAPRYTVKFVDATDSAHVYSESYTYEPGTEQLEMAHFDEFGTDIVAFNSSADLKGMSITAGSRWTFDSLVAAIESATGQNPVQPAGIRDYEILIYAIPNGYVPPNAEPEE